MAGELVTLAAHYGVAGPCSPMRRVKASFTGFFLLLHLDALFSTLKSNMAPNVLQYTKRPATFSATGSRRVEFRCCSRGACIVSHDLGDKDMSKELSVVARSRGGALVLGSHGNRPENSSAILESEATPRRSSARGVRRIASVFGE